MGENFIVNVEEASPTLESSVTTGGQLEEMELDGDRIYVVGNRGFRILEAAPSLGALSWTHGPGYTMMTGLARQGNKLYVSRLGVEGLVIFDTRNPQSPVELGRTLTVGIAWDVAVYDNTAYVAHGILGIGFYDVSDPSQPSWTGQMWPGGRIVSVSVSRKEKLLAAGRDNGKVYIYSLAGEEPELVAEVEAEGRLGKVKLREGRLWVLGKQGNQVEIFEPEKEAGQWEKAGEVSTRGRKYFWAKTKGSRGYTLGKKTVEAYLFESGS